MVVTTWKVGTKVGTKVGSKMVNWLCMHYFVRYLIIEESINGDDHMSMKAK